MQRDHMYSKLTLLYAAKSSLIYLAWLIAVIGIPVVFFGESLSVLSKLAVLFFVYLGVWLVYFLLCLVFHRIRLRRSGECERFMGLSPKERGREIGTFLEGW